MKFKVVLLLFLLFLPSFAVLEWWDSDWDYRTCMEVNSTEYEREYWPVEFELNVTDEFLASGGSGTVNTSSLRLIEQDTSSGASLYETPHQFDRATEFDATANFYGTFSWVLNGTTAAQSARTYCLYYDNDTKPASSYTNISYTWDGEEFQINVSVYDDSAGSMKGLQYWIDTSRGANTSGIYRLKDYSGNNFWTPPTESELPVTFMRYSNSTNNFTFDLQKNLTIVHSGPTRVVAEQSGPEVFWNSTKQAEGFMTKRYTFYNQSQWIKVEQIYRNDAGYSVTRNSTSAGALAFNVSHADLNNITMGNGTDPGSWWWFAAEFANFHAGIINVNDTGPFLSVDRNDTAGLGGIELNDIAVAAGETIQELAALHFNSISQIRGYPTDAQVKGLRNRLLNPENTTKILSEKWDVQINTSTDYTEYNRGENITFTVNATVDSGLITLVNATLEPSHTFELYDDGTHGDLAADDDLYTNYMVINETNATGQWNLTATAWDKDNTLLSTDNHSFNVHDNYIATLNVINDYGFINRTVRSTMTVTNYRNDSAIAGASINCSYDSTYPKLNVTDHGDGNYSINFTAPSSYGEFTLTCNATSLGNIGTGTDPFTAVEYTTDVTSYFNFTGLGINNVTLSNSQTTPFVANVTNLGNGTAYSINISLSPPSGWVLNSSFEQAGDLNLSDVSRKFFEITVPANQTSGTYVLNATVDWLNADDSVDQANTTFDMVVQENPFLRIPTTNITTVVSPGDWNNIENITVRSRGNYPLQNVTFNVTGLSNMTFNFTPTNITHLFQGEDQLVEVWVFVPEGHSRGNFNGTLNASDALGAEDTVNLSLSIMETFMNVSSNTSYILADQVRWYDFQNFTVIINSTNIGYSTAIDTNVTLVLNETFWRTNVTDDTHHCGDVPSEGWCAAAFEIGVMRSLPGNYTVIANTSWMNPGVGMTYNTTNFTIEVPEFVEFDIDESNVTGTVEHGRENFLGNFTLRNTGNTQVDDVNSVLTGLTDFNVTLDPTVNFIPVGSVIDVGVNVSVPEGYAEGYQTGELNYTSSNAETQSVILNVTVLESKSWTLLPLECTALTPYEEGTVCEVQVTNNGNVPVNVSISPESANYTYVNTTNFTLIKQASQNFTVLWNLTGVPRDFYNATYNVSVEGGQPLWQPLNISLIPSELPDVNMSLSTNVTQELQDVVVYANVTDNSQQGLVYVRLRVTMPDGSNETYDMNLQNQDNHTYEYSLAYPGSWGSGDQRGFYDFRVDVQDGLGLSNHENDTAYFYPLVEVSADTGFDTYFPAESGSFYINITDQSGTPLVSNVSLELTGPDGFVRYQENFTTSGYIEPIPTFELPDDASLGNYTFAINASHHDNVTDIDTYTYKTSKFLVREEYNVEFETSVVWYPDSVMKFYVLAYTDRGFVEPDSISLDVYDPAEAEYFSSSSFNTFNSTNSSRLYVHSHAMAADTALGYYLADLKISEGGRTIEKLKSFRVSAGGPYDVVITDIDSEVSPSQNLEFEILLENMGDVRQDVFLDYWIEGPGNDTYDSVSGEAILVEPGGNRTLNRSLAIFSDQATGDYTLNARLEYSPLKAPIEVSRSFRVVSLNETEEEEEEEPPDIIEPVQAAVIEMTLTNIFPEEMILNRGSLGYLTVEIKNTGNVKLTDITAFFEDIDRDWFEVVRGVDSLGPGGSGYLVVKFQIPSDATARTYVSNMRIIAKEVEVSEFYKVMVFKTQEQALRAKINSLRSTLADLEDRTGTLAAQGVDVTRILSLLRKGRDMLDVSESYLSEGKSVEAIETVSNVESVIEEIRYRLEISRPGRLPEISVPEITPKWYLIGLSAFALILFLLFFGRKLIHYQSKGRKRTVSKIKRALSQSEKAKADSDVIETLKKQYREGLLSRETFEELKGILK